jgi:hypothetical protein
VKDRPRALAVLIAVFLGGCIIGSSGSFFWLRLRYKSEIEKFGIFPPRRSPERRLSEELQLTPEQNTRYLEISAEFRRGLDAIRVEQAPKFEKIKSDFNRKLSEILNEEQRNKFEAFLKRMERERRPPDDGRRPEPPPRP